jgi:hypothetical protein
VSALPPTVGVAHAVRSDGGHVFGGRSGLFSKVALPDEARQRTDHALGTVARADVNDLLNRDLDVLVDEMLTPLQQATVRWDDVTMTDPAPKTAASTDVFGHRVSLSMASTTFSVPVDGDPLLLTYFSHNGAPMNGIDGRVRAGAVEFRGPRPYNFQRERGLPRTAQTYCDYLIAADDFVQARNRRLAAHAATIPQPADPVCQACLDTANGVHQRWTL